MNEARAYVELLYHIESAVECGENLFKLSELYNMYMERLSDFGINKIINKTRLKNKLLEHFSDLQEENIQRWNAKSAKGSAKTT
jgi:hypothetical protein